MVSWCIVKYRMFVFLLLSHENKTGKTTQVSSKSVPIPILPVSSPPAMVDCPFQAADQSMPEDVKAIRSTLAAVADPQLHKSATELAPQAMEWPCPVHSASVTYHEQERAAGLRSKNAHPFLSPKQAPTAMRGRRCVICNPRHMQRASKVKRAMHLHFTSGDSPSLIDRYTAHAPFCRCVRKHHFPCGR